MKLTNIEFTGLPDGEVEVRMNNQIFTLLPSHREFIDEFISMLINKRTASFEALQRRYKMSKSNNHYYEFLIVRGFIKCNFIVHDNKLDIDENGNFNTEFVLCPMIGECKDFGIVCNGPTNTDLSEREIEVLRLISQGDENVEIADKLYISINTVHNHRNNILKKLGKKNTAELVRYWFESEME